MGRVANLWPLDQNKWPKFQKKSPSNFFTIAGDPSPSQGGMGFRDPVIFNKAVLAKQCWRLLQKENPNSLAADILKAKYYPNTNVLEDSLGK